MAFPQIGIEAVLVLQKFDAESKKYESELASMQKKTEDVAKRIQDATAKMSAAVPGTAGFADAQENLAGLQGEMQGLEQENANLAMSFGDPISFLVRFATAVYQGTEALYKMSEQSALVTNAANSFAALSAQSGISAEALLADLQKISNGEVATADLIMATNRALLAGGASFYEDLPKIFEIAEAVARSSGGNVVDVYGELVRAIANGEPRYVRTTGLMIGGKDALDSYATSINKTVAELTAQERAEGTRLAVLAAGEKAIKATNAAGKDAGETFDQLHATWKNFTTGIGVLFAPVAEIINDRLQLIISGFKGAASSLGGFSSVIIRWREILDGSLTPLQAFQEGFDNTYKTLEYGIKPMEDLTGVIGDLGDQEAAAAAAAAELAKKLADLTSQRLEKMNALQKQWADKDVDTAIQRARQLEDAERNLGYQLEDAAREYNRNRDKIYKDNGKKIADIESQNIANLAAFELDSQKQREDLTAKHVERLRQINQSYADTEDEAVRKNDAVAIVQARRQRDRELRDAEISKTQEQNTLDTSLAEKRQKLADDYALQKQAEQVRMQEQLTALDEQRALDDENMRIHLERQNAEREIAWARQDADFQMQKSRQLRDLDDWFAQEQAKLTGHLATMTTIAVQAIKEAGNAIASTASEAASQVAQSAITPASSAWSNRHDYLGGEGASTGKTSDQWLNRHNYMAEGGIGVVSRPTTFVAGEAGPEVAAFVPMRGGASNVNHSFGKLGIDFNNLPSGLDTSQAQGLVYQTIVALARAVRTRNR